jgi:hypothetical protein
MRRPSHLPLALFILYLTAVCRAQSTCVKAFANFTTCAVLNGVPADGDFARVKKTLAIEAEVLLAYSKDNMITRNDACKQAFAAFECVKTTNNPQQSFVAGKWVDLFSAPCKSDGLRLKPCYEWCVKLQQTCYTKSELQIEFDCSFMSVNQGGACFGDDGVRGMLPPPSSSDAHLARDDLVPNLIALAAAVSLAGISF